MELQNSRRQKVQSSLNLTTEKEYKSINKSIEKEERRKQRKWEKQVELQNSASFRSVKAIQEYMDTWFLDPIIGFFLPGFGDLLTSFMTLPFIYVSLFKIRSLPLTLAVIYNMLVDCLLGTIPFFIGDIIDAFNRSYKKSYKLIVGFVEDDREIIRDVNKKALFMAIMICIVCVLIYLLVSFVISLTSAIYEWIAGLFA